MDNQNLVLYVAAYADASAASSDYEVLQGAEDDTDLEVVGSVVLSRDESGKVTVHETGGGQVAGGAVIGGSVGLVVGLFAPPLLLATAIGAGAGAVIGELSKEHEEKKMGAEVEEYRPLGSSAIVVVLDDQYLDRVDAALANSEKKVDKAIDSGDYDKIQKAISEASDDVTDAVDS